MKYDVITIGGAVVDIIMRIDDALIIDNKSNLLIKKLLAFEQGAKFEIDDTYKTFGGGAANAAVNFARLGFETAAIVPVGTGENGKAVVANFKKQGVDISLVQKIEKETTGYSFIIIDKEQERTVFTYRGASGYLSIGKKELRAMKKSSWIYVSSMSGKWQKVLGGIVNEKEYSKYKIAWNPGVSQLSLGYGELKIFLKKINMLMLNKDEALELVITDPACKEYDRNYLNSINNLLRIISGYGPETVIITDGKKGAFVLYGGKNYSTKIKKEKIKVDSTGLGDAFNSSFLAGVLAYKGDIKKAMALGVRTTASVIAKAGAQNGLLTKKNI